MKVLEMIGEKHTGRWKGLNTKYDPALTYNRDKEYQGEVNIDNHIVYQCWSKNLSFDGYVTMAG